MASHRVLAGLALALVACGEAPQTPEARSDVVLRFRAEPPPGGEAYLCFGFDPAAIAGFGVRSIAWEPPAGGGVAIHHASLYAVSGDFLDGPTPCDAMPGDAVGLHAWAPGVAPLELPDEIALILPESTARLVIQAHAIRTGDAPAEEASVRIGAAPVFPERSAAWLGISAPVPAIRPHHEETSTGSCRIAAPLRAVRVWPHMHRVGHSFHGEVIREGGARAPLIDVPEWDFDRQEAYPIDMGIGAGDTIEITCAWQNPTDHYVLPGLHTGDEMCNAGLIVAPAEAAACAEP